MSNEFDLDDFEIETGTTGEIEAVGPISHRSTTRLLVIDPSRTESPITHALEAAGFGCSQVETGGQAMQAIGAGQFASLICVATGDDDDWRRFLAAGVRQRYENFPVVFTARTPTDSERDRLLQLGASMVLPAPLPSLRELGLCFDKLLNLEAQNEPIADPASEMALLKRRLRDAEESGRLKDKEIDELKGQFIRAIDEASLRTTESTGLRSEMSMLRDHASVMKDRLVRAKNEIQWLKQETVRLAQAPGSEPLQIPKTGEIERRMQELQGLLAALLPFHQALEGAVAFLEDLAIVAGPRAAALQKHVRQLSLLRDVFARIRSRVDPKRSNPAKDDDKP